MLNLELGNGVTDHLNVFGNVTLGEDLIINLIFQYIPAFDEVFAIEDFFSFASFALDPAFDLGTNVNALGLPRGSSIILTLEDQRRQIQTAVPEPSPIIVILGALIALLCIPLFRHTFSRMPHAPPNRALGA